MITDIRAPEHGSALAIGDATGAGSLADVPMAAVEAALKTHGAVLIRGFAPDVAAFRAFSDPFCSSWVMNEAPNRDLIDPEHNIQSVDRGGDPFSLHSEMSRAPWRPDICFFYCVRAPSSGGETTICDGREIVRALPAEVRDGLLRQRFLYMRNVSTRVLEFWLGTETPSAEQLANPPAACPFRFIRRENGVVSVFTRPALPGSLFGDEPVLANFLLFAREMHRNLDYPLLANGRRVPDEWVAAIQETSRKLTQAVCWQDGDLLLLDNSRFMHGRARVLDTDERVIASRFGYLKGVSGDPEGPADPIWRRGAFVPPGK
ncbi:TauD/TfdA family dioxygenase [Sphingomonas sp. AOB5]|uniref:TauD/TfdA family dioxygenase n=1 Tax=Sphingomonas sp. AOB5 TaxID=3034017 RepID=UPI0023F8A7F7|nr:TauD/TfdA family dioxygenase [Sphingomonas sp. AOB5]MDF7774467.1 TauD/TfdA family dioxygenase [Sphingomonas sp. AOB5]